MWGSVLDFGLGQGRAIPQAPMHGLLALVDQPLLDEPAERSDDCRLKAGRHRQVRGRPVTEDPQAFEVLTLRGDEPLGVRPACLPELDGRSILGGRSELALDIELDRQAVTVPSGDVRRVETRHTARLDDEVLQNLVECGADVDLAVGVGRAIVQHEPGRLAPRGAEFGVPDPWTPSGPASPARWTAGWPSSGSPSAADSGSLSSRA